MVNLGLFYNKIGLLEESLETFQRCLNFTKSNNFTYVAEQCDQFTKHNFTFSYLKTEKDWSIHFYFL